MNKKIIIILVLLLTLLVGCTNEYNNASVQNESDVKILKQELEVLQNNLNEKEGLIEDLKAQIDELNILISNSNDELDNKNVDNAKYDEFLKKLDWSEEFEINTDYYYWLKVIGNDQYLSRYSWENSEYESILQLDYMSDHEYIKIKEFKVSKDNDLIVVVAITNSNEEVLLIYDSDIRLINQVTQSEISNAFGESFTIPNGMGLTLQSFSVENKYIRGMIADNIEGVGEYAINLFDFSIITDQSPDGIWSSEYTEYPNANN